MTRLLVGLLILSLCLLPPAPASACSPAAWDAREILAESKAILLGTVTRVSKDGRWATLEVERYVGPGAAPRLVELSPTVDSRAPRPEGEERIGPDRAIIPACPDISVRFERGRRYVVGLGEIAPPSLIRPSGRTAFPVDEQGRVLVTIYGDKEPAEQFLAAVAAGKGLALQEAEAGAPAWRQPGGAAIWFYLAGAGLLLAGSAPWVARLLRRPEPR
ncbi:MAG: hypothetical protein ACOY93_06480 [Bacillota bacterium]